MRKSHSFTINAAADLQAIAAGINLLVPVPIELLIVPIGILILIVQVWGSYRVIEKIFRWLALKAQALSECKEPELIEAALESVRRIFGMQNRRLTSLLSKAHAYNWQADPFSQGAYSYELVNGPARVLDLPTHW